RHVRYTIRARDDACDASSFQRASTLQAPSHDRRYWLLLLLLNRDELRHGLAGRFAIDAHNASPSASSRYEGATTLHAHGVPPIVRCTVAARSWPLLCSMIQPSAMCCDDLDATAVRERRRHMVRRHHHARAVEARVVGPEHLDVANAGIVGNVGDE